VDGYEEALIQVLANGGARAEAEARLKAIPADQQAQIFHGLAALGRPQEALDRLDPASFAVQVVGDLFVSSALDPVRHDPRFVKLIATLGLTEAHARAQAWRAARAAGENSWRRDPARH
jgi:hypothetical protein